MILNFIERLLNESISRFVATFIFLAYAISGNALGIFIWLFKITSKLK